MRPNWTRTRLGDVCSIATGKKDVNEGNPAGPYPFFTCSRTHTFSDSFSFDTEAILIAGNGDVGSLHYYQGKFEAYQRTYVLSDFRVPTDYVWHVLNAFLATRLGLGKIGSSIPYIKRENIAGFELNLPPLPEQRAIAAALSDVDALIASLDRLIAKKRDLKQATMQQLLTGKTRLPGFRGAWERITLGAIAQFRPGTYLPQASYSDGPVEVHGAGALMGFYDQPNYAQALTVIGRVGTVGRPRFMPNGCWVNNNAGAILSRDNSCPEYVYLLLTTVDWPSISSITAQPFLNVSDLLNVEFDVPVYEEQCAIARVVFDMDAEIAALEARRDKTKLLKQGMMQELLTGRTRLV